MPLREENEGRVWDTPACGLVLERFMGLLWWPEIRSIRLALTSLPSLRVLVMGLGNFAEGPLGLSE